jgi:hypothetical protein
MKKPHPCGSYEWEILRTGIFVQIRCCGCDRHVEMHRDAFEKGTRKIINPSIE